MTLKHLCILLLALVAAGSVVGQSEDIPVENDNQFPPDNPAKPEGDIIEGSGAGTIEDPLTTKTEPSPTPQLEDIQTPALSNTVLATSSEGEFVCPIQCLCHIEGSPENFVVDCSGYELTEFPTPLDSRTTSLNIQNNKLTEIPKDVSALKNLKVLNADNNLIMDLAPGSVSELSELTVLKLANNRLIEFPKDLKNSFGLTKLEELDLGGNDMRTKFNPEVFASFKSLRTLTLPTSSTETLEDLCRALKESLLNVCTGSCSTQSFDCPEGPENIGTDLLVDATLPAAIPFGLEDENADPAAEPVGDNAKGTENTPLEPVASSDSSVINDATEVPTVASDNTAPLGVVASRAAINKDTEEATQIKMNSAVVEAPKDDSTKPESDVKIGATTTSTNTGGVDKSVIGIIVAGMVVVVAGITIKKNWSSIKKRFSSSPRSANDRGGANANGTTPEEVPLQEKQDKSPV